MAFDYGNLNIKGPGEAWLCPSCGFDGAFDGSSFDARGPIVGTGICHCCLYEPGFDDVVAASGTDRAKPIDALREYSAIWFASGMAWRGTRMSKPMDWSAATQRGVWERYCRPRIDMAGRA